MNIPVIGPVWDFFSTYILRQAPWMIGFITMIGYILMKKKWYDVLGGTLKAIIGMLILNVGSGGLTSNFRPILAGLKDRFNLTAAVIDPYYGQNAVTAGVEEQFGAAFSSLSRDAAADRIHRQHTAGALQQDHQVPLTVHHRPCAVPAGRHGLLADPVRAARTVAGRRQDRSDADRHVRHPGRLLGRGLQPDG